jgi:formiminotetrahydrofolate cyclodeaminase
VALSSPGAKQTYSVSEQKERALMVANALEQAADGPSESVAEAHRIASEIKQEVTQPEPSTGRLKKLFDVGSHGK